MKAIEKGYDVRFTTIQDLAGELRASMADNTTEERIAELTEPDLVVLDELGFTPLDRLLADAFYRIIASRYERKSIIVTSNKSFESWAEVFPDAVIASAVLDRLVHHAHLVPIVGESYRMKELKGDKKGGERRKKSA
jgi:DNA replication protein DnaC